LQCVPSGGFILAVERGPHLLDRLPIRSGGGGGDWTEPRIAKLETDVVHLSSDVSDVRTDFREFRNVDFRELRNDVRDIRTSIANLKIWALVLYIALCSALILAGWTVVTWLIDVIQKTHA
jgi:hypothetical protein